MGFFSKIFKGVKKGFKKIGKGIKTAFKSFGKFMGKIGVLGQIAMMFILPSIGGALMEGLASIGTKITGALAGSGSVVLQGAGRVLQGAANFISKGANVFRNVTEGVTNFIGEFSKTAANKLSSTLGFERVPFADASANFFGSGDTAWSRSTSSFTNRMTNLTADKDFIKDLDADFIKGLDATSKEMAFDSSRVVTSDIAEATKKGKAMSLSDTAVDMTQAPEGYSVVTPDVTAATKQASLMADPTSLEVPTQVITDGTAEKIMEEASDTSWWDNFKQESREQWDFTRENFVPDTVKRLSGAVTDAPARAFNMVIDKSLQEEPEEQFGTIGAAQQQMMDIGETMAINPNQFAVNYGVRIAQNPYGNNALQAAVHSNFLNTSLNSTGYSNG